MEEGKSFYQGRSHRPRVGRGEKSAEVIVVVGNEPLNESEVSQDNEGLNDALLEIR